MICRDRSGWYADGARTGAPDAVQVADRFHLWQNLAKAVEKCVAAQRACLAEPAAPAAGGPEPEAAGAADAGPTDRRGSSPTPPAASTNWFTACGPRGTACGRSPATWAGACTPSSVTTAATWQELADGRWQAPRASKLDPFKPYLDQHVGQGHGSFTRLFNEIKKLGHDGSYSVVRNYLDQTRPEKALLREAPPTVRDVTNWLRRRPDTLTEDEQLKLKAVLGRCPELRAASALVRGFATMITDLTGPDLPQWMAAAREG